MPEEIQRLLGDADRRRRPSSGEVLDIYDAAGMPKPSLDDLDAGVHRQDAAGAGTRSWPSRRCGR